VHHLGIKMLNIIDARCNHELYKYLYFRRSFCSGFVI